MKWVTGNRETLRISQMRYINIYFHHVGHSGIDTFTAITRGGRRVVNVLVTDVGSRIRDPPMTG